MKRVKVKDLLLNANDNDRVVIKYGDKLIAAGNWYQDQILDCNDLIVLTWFYRGKFPFRYLYIYVTEDFKTI